MIESKINNNGMQTKAWGPPTWAFLYFCAKGYPEKIDYTNADHVKRKKAMKRQLKSIGYTLPCSLCRKSYCTFIHESDTRLKNYLESRDDVMLFIYKIYNKVNDKLCVPTCKRPSFETVQKFYEQFRAGCCSTEKFGCRKPGETNPSVYANITYEPRAKNTNPYYHKIIPLDIDEDELNIECINHILYNDNKHRNFEYYNQLNDKYKTVLDNLLFDNNLKIDITDNSLIIKHIDS